MRKRANYLPLCSFTCLNTARASPFSLLARVLPFFQPCLILHALQQFCLHIPVKYLGFFLQQSDTVDSSSLTSCVIPRSSSTCLQSCQLIQSCIEPCNFFISKHGIFTFFFLNCSLFPSVQTTAPTCQDHFELSPCLPAFWKLGSRSEFNKHALSFVFPVIEENSEYCCPQEMSIQYPTSNAMLHQ